MKKLWLLVILLFAVTIGFAFIACGDDNGNGGSDDVVETPGDDDDANSDKGSIKAAVNSSTITPAANDLLRLAVFTNLPPPPAPPTKACNTQVEKFPGEITLTEIPPGDYFVFACFDKDGDNTQCNGEGDVEKWLDDGNNKIKVEAGKTAEISINLD